jgi:DNA invertase Pin-like site-specific DNA recombinase
VTTPAVLYAAKSTIDKNESIPTQLQEGRDLAESEQREVAGEFSDEKASAYSGDRGPELVAAKALAERLAAEHGECHLIIQHSDRLARGDGIQAAHLVEYALWAIKCSVKIRSIQDPGTFADLLYAVVTGQRNHEDSRRKSAAVKAGMERRRLKGLHNGGPRPWGYRMEDGRLVPFPDEVPIIRRVFTECKGGKSLNAIARTLNEDGIPPRRGRLWRSATISQIVRNPVYVGEISHNGERLPGDHEAIIERALWDDVQAILAARPSRGRGRPSAGRHLFRKGMLRCGHCGEAVVPRTNGGYEMYYCNGRSKMRVEFCDLPHLRRAVVDSAVFSYFEQVGLDIEATRRQLAESRDEKLVEIRALVGQAESEKHKAEERLERVRRDYTDGELTAADWAGFRDELEGQLRGATGAVDQLTERLAIVEAWGELADTERDMLQGLAELRKAVAGEVADASTIEAVRPVLSKLFEHFTIHQVKPGQRVHAELAWQGRDHDLIIEPTIREQAIAGYSNLRPVFRREAIYGAPATNDKSPSPTFDCRSLFEPFLVPDGAAPKRSA